MMAAHGIRGVMGYIFQIRDYATNVNYASVFVCDSRRIMMYDHYDPGY